MPRNVIVNADDFGFSPGINRGIIQAFEHGIVTSASLMVRQPAAAAAAGYARSRQELSVGLHLDFGEWVPLNHQWVPLYQVVPTDNVSKLSGELAFQLGCFRELMGMNPTHLDSHQHVHRQEPLRTLVLALGAELRVPVRELTTEVFYCGDFYGQGAEGESLPDILTIEGLKRILKSLPVGTSELACHPGYNDGLATPYADERARELEVLCSPEIRDFINKLGIELVSFQALHGHK